MQKLTVAPYASVGIQNKKLYVGFGSIQFEESDPQKSQKYLEIIRYFKSPHTLTEAKSEFAQWNDFSDLYEKLKSQNIFIDSESYRRGERFSRQSLFFNLSGFDPVESQKNLAAKRVTIIGCGGIGNQVSVHLATAGVREFVLCDNDTIEISNLSRQILFREEDAGELKVEILARELKSRVTGLKVRTLAKHITNTNDLEFALGSDFIVVSADSGNVVNTVNRFCVKNKIPYMNVGYVNDISIWGPLYIPGKTGCYSCQDIIAGDGESSSLQELVREINRGYQAPSVGPVNMISSGLASLDILKFLAGRPETAQSLNRRMGLWTHNLKLDHQDCSKNPDCRVCGVAL